MLLLPGICKDAMINRPDICGSHLVPRPIARDRERIIDDEVEAPFLNESYYWGILDHKSAEGILLGLEAGSFLIRRSGSTTTYYTLSVRFNGLTKHFKLYFESGEFSLGRHLKRFQSIDDLVGDGLINYHLEQIHRRDTETPTTTAVVNNDKNNLLLSREPVVQLRREHVFKGHTFRGLNWCEVCAQFLWGFSGVKCENCSFVAHKKCSESVVTKECCLLDNDASTKGPTFGVELSSLIAKQATSIPFIVTKCVEEIELRGINQEGIYRVSGFADEVDELKAAFMKHGRQTNISAESLNIHTVAGVLKLFFRSLPKPLISEIIARECTALMTNEEDMDAAKQLKLMRTNLLKLPTAHWNCLKYMANHLRRVTNYQETNKMNETNLATVFAPTLIGTELKIFTDLAQEIHLLTLIIKHNNILFSS